MIMKNFVENLLILASNFLTLVGNSLIVVENTLKNAVKTAMLKWVTTGGGGAKI
jgi:hypothetical protein